MGKGQSKSSSSSSSSSGSADEGLDPVERAVRDATKTKKLSVAKTGLETVPQSFMEIEGVKELWLQENSIVSFPSCPDELWTNWKDVEL